MIGMHTHTQAFMHIFNVYFLMDGPLLSRQPGVHGIDFSGIYIMVCFSSKTGLFSLFFQEKLVCFWSVGLLVWWSKMLPISIGKVSEFSLGMELSLLVLAGWYTKVEGVIVSAC